MDFLNLDLNKLFLKKFGNNIYNKILTEINFENPKYKNNNLYIELIFKIAFYNFIGLSNTQIINFLQPTFLNINIQLKDIFIIHKDSIKLIQQYFQNIVDESLKEEN